MPVTLWSLMSRHTCRSLAPRQDPRRLLMTTAADMYGSYLDSAAVAVALLADPAVAAAWDQASACRVHGPRPGRAPGQAGDRRPRATRRRAAPARPHRDAAPAQPRRARARHDRGVLAGQLAWRVSRLGKYSRQVRRF